MHTSVQITCLKYVPGSQHFWTNKFLLAWLVYILYWEQVVKVHCEQTQIVLDKNRWSITAHEYIRCRYSIQTENSHII